MAQLRHDYQKFKAFGTEVLVITPNGPMMIARHVREHGTPYPILSDTGAKVAEQYLVRMQRVGPFFKVFPPSVFLVDQTGKIGYAAYLSSLTAEPDNREALAVLAKMAG